MFGSIKNEPARDFANSAIGTLPTSVFEKSSPTNSRRQECSIAASYQAELAAHIGEERVICAE